MRHTSARRRAGQFAVLAAVGGAMIFSAVSAAAASTGTASSNTASSNTASSNTASSNTASSNTASSSPRATSAPTPANASAVSDAKGLRVTGFGGPNKITISQLPGQTKFKITDTAPISVGVGCSPLPLQAGLFAIQCQALPGSGGTQFRSFSVVSGSGDDIVTNAAPAAMLADGGLGNDTLIGGAFGDNLRDSAGSDTLRGNGGQDDLNTESNAAGGGKDLLDGGAELDILKAGPGNDTLLGGSGKDRLVGNRGSDTLDAGTGSGDVVAYEGRTARVVVVLDNVRNDGEAGEGDFISNAEIIQGGRGPDTMIGDGNANIFEGFDGDDVLIGGRGADDLRGGLGNDRLASNDLFGVPVQDGSIDKLDGFDGVDYCRVPFVEPDITIGCEIVDKD